MSGRKFSKRFTFKELKEESTPQKIVYATLQEIAANGLSGTTTKGISERADLSTGIIHHYFDTKDNLIYAAYVYLVLDLQQRTLEIFKHETDPKTRLQALIRMSFATVHVSSEARDVWVHFWADAIHDERVFRLLNIYYRRYRSNLASAFRGILHDSQKSKEAAQHLLASIHGVWFTHRFADSPKERERAIQLIEKQLDMILLSLR
uniref:HTH-type transcriptional regulator BetI n=1 Tax=uncultured Thiotrichaceae bacterium TaxID=298394 RepID=A0A6S6UMB6_9GAMM|nr:MAG: HTH-type transcriptional regulator BetI [uncultured Thiotrichaceae bacterium]